MHYELNNNWTFDCSNMIYRHAIMQCFPNLCTQTAAELSRHTCVVSPMTPRSNDTRHTGIVGPATHCYITLIHQAKLSRHTGIVGPATHFIRSYRTERTKMKPPNLVNKWWKRNDCCSNQLRNSLLSIFALFVMNSNDCQYQIDKCTRVV